VDATPLAPMKKLHREGSISFGSASKRIRIVSRPTSRSDSNRHTFVQRLTKVTKSTREIGEGEAEIRRSERDGLVAPRGSALSNSRVIRPSSISVSGSARATLRGRNLPATPRVARLKSLVRRQLITRERRERPCGNAGSATARCNNHARP